MKLVDEIMKVMMVTIKIINTSLIKILSATNRVIAGNIAIAELSSDAKTIKTIMVYSFLFIIHHRAIKNIQIRCSYPIFFLKSDEILILFSHLKKYFNCHRICCSYFYENDYISYTLSINRK